MRTDLKFLKKAKDYKILSKYTFKYLFNEHRGGHFSETMPEQVHAYGVYWKIQQKWIDKAWGRDYYYEYISNDEPSLPQKILIETDSISMPQYTKTTEELRYYGKLIFTQDDNWGRLFIIWLHPFKKELEECNNESEILKKIEEIQNREYYKSLLKELDYAGLTKRQKRKFFRIQPGWKYEELLLKMELVNRQDLPKELFYRLACSLGHAEFNKLAKKWNLEEEFYRFSFPRKVAYAELIEKLKYDKKRQI